MNDQWLQSYFLWLYKIIAIVISPPTPPQPPTPNINSMISEKYSKASQSCCNVFQAGVLCFAPFPP